MLPYIAHMDPMGTIIVSFKSVLFRFIQYTKISAQSNDDIIDEIPLHSHILRSSHDHMISSLVVKSAKSVSIQNETSLLLVLYDFILIHNEEFHPHSICAPHPHKISTEVHHMTCIILGKKNNCAQDIP